ncbi:MAG: hypothetical protein U5N86_03950 [Planctomycetota bacterium]|nr:hypothetical protein [Planctomycetota bacterium]
MRTLTLSAFLVVLSYVVLPLGVTFAESGLLEMLPKTGSGRITAKSLWLNPFTLYDLTANIKVEGPKILFTDITGKCCEGDVSGFGHVMLDTKPVSYVFTLDFVKLDSEALKKELELTSKLILGKLSGRMTANGDFGKNPELRLDGNLTMDGAKGDIISRASTVFEYEMNNLSFTEMLIEPFGGGTITGKMTFHLETKKKGFMTGQLHAKGMEAKTAMGMFGNSPEWLEGSLDGNIDIRRSWDRDVKDYYFSGNISDMQIKVFNVPLSGSSSFEYTEQKLYIRDFKGGSCGGTVTGTLSVEEQFVQLDAEAKGVIVERMFKNLGIENKIKGEGNAKASLKIMRKKLEILGEGFFEIIKGDLGEAPGIVSIVSVIPLPSLTPHEFTDASAVLHFTGTRILVEDAQLISSMLKLKKGNGYVDLDGSMRLLFEPHSSSNPISAILQAIGLDPASMIFRIEVKGNIRDPQSSMRPFPKKIDEEEQPPPDEPELPEDGEGNGEKPPQPGGD